MANTKARAPRERRARRESVSAEGPSSRARLHDRRARVQHGRWGHTFAALDLGTNNCRLLIAKPTEDGFRVVDAFSRIVRLGEGVAVSGRISEDAIDRTVAALKICASKMRRRSVTRSRCIATEACRQAANGDAFLERVRAETGLTFEAISPAMEAELALAGCASLLDPTSRRSLVFDIGGGSTELTWVGIAPDRPPQVLGWTSLSCGVVGLSEQHGGREPTRAHYDAMIEQVRALLEPFVATLDLSSDDLNDGTHLLGTSGTVTTLAAVHLGLPRYDRDLVDGAWMLVRDIAGVVARLSEMSYEQRVAHPCIRRGRADLVVAGCAIMEAISRLWPVERLRIADRGLREGMLLALMSATDAEGAERAVVV